MSTQEERDIEKQYSVKQYVAKLRRLADALEAGKPFTIQVAGEKIRVPLNAAISIEHERSDDEEELEFQLKWVRDNGADDDDDDLEVDLEDEDEDEDDNGDGESVE